MAVELISFPFRLLPNGRLALVEQDTDGQYGEEIAAVMLTKPGERDLVPDLGIDDPAYYFVDRAQVQEQVDLFEIPVTIEEVETSHLDSTVQDVTVYFE